MLAKILGILFLILLSPLILIRNIYQLMFKDKVRKKAQSKKRFVEFTTNGFNVLNYKHEIVKQITWKQVVNIKWESELDQKIYFNLTQGESLVLDRHFTGYWYGILRHIPEGYISFDYDASNKIFKNLETCEFCGYIAVGSYKCRHCNHLPWHLYSNKDKVTKSDYIQKKMDKMRFRVIDPESKASDLKLNTPKLDCGFEKDPNVSTPPLSTILKNNSLQLH